MKKKTLKVQPARRIYQPKYPSFEDKNPLLYPESRPYPFNLKFIKWASTGGLASIMLLGGNDVLGQTQTDSLYNPFPLENARVPYQPVSFGTGMPERLRSEEVRQAIMNAFIDSGIELNEEVWLQNEDFDAFMSGYSAKDEIGFVLIDYTNMDESFKNKSSRRNDNRIYQKNRFNFNQQVKIYQERQAQQFQRFISDKEKVVSNLTKYDKGEVNKSYAEKLSTLEATKESEALFNTYFLEYELDDFRHNYRKRSGLTKDICDYIDNRFDELMQKKILFNYVHNIRKTKYTSSEYIGEIERKFDELKKIESNEKFISGYFELLEFHAYDSGSYQLLRDSTYQKLKLNIMRQYPRKKWLDNVEKLDEYQDRKFLSLKEAKIIDKCNKKGTRFIAPISVRDNIMIVPNGYGSSSDELTEESALLRKEYNEKNGMTDEILVNRRSELRSVSKKYKTTSEDSKQERDSIRTLKREEKDVINAKYKAMEKLSDEERLEFDAKFKDLHKRQNEWRKANAEVVRMEVLRKLEDEVKIYIKWAKSQMGG